MTERLHFHFSLSCIGEGNGNPLQCSCLENPRDGEAWWAAIYGVAQSWTRLKRLSSSSIIQVKRCSRILCWINEMSLNYQRSHKRDWASGAAHPGLLASLKNLSPGFQSQQWSWRPQVSTMASLHFIPSSSASPWPLISLGLNFLPKQKYRSVSITTTQVWNTLGPSSYSHSLHGEGDGTPLQYSCLENPMDGGA